MATLDAYDTKPILDTARTISVLGASTDVDKAGYYVPEHLAESGYRIIPVNPSRVGETVFGEPFRASLADVNEPIDIIDVFRPSAEVRAHVPEILALDPLPKLVWFQQDIRDDEAASELAAAGIDVVQDACLMVMHRILTRND